MSGWFMDRRPAFFEALSTVCDQLDHDLAQEVQSKEEEHNRALREREELLQSTTTRVDRLVEENTRLKQQLEQASNARKEASSRPLGSEPDWKAECVKVSVKYKALSQNFKTAKEALQRRKDERDKWISHATLLEKKIRAAEGEHGISIINSRATSRLGDRHEAVKPSPAASFASEAGLDRAELELPPLAATSLQCKGETSNAATQTVNTLSESTQGESSPPRYDDDLPLLPDQTEAGEVQIKPEPSSDGPVVVSERVIRKRKRDEPSNTIASRKVKIEPSNSSSPILSLEGRDFELQESIDLGDVAQKTLTPRKRKEAEACVNSILAEELTAARTPGPLFVRPDPIMQPARAAQKATVLTPVSVNRRTAVSGSSKKPGSLDRGVSYAITFLAEDGGIYKDTDTGLNTPSTTKSAAKGRLDALLNNPSATEEPSLSLSKARYREKGARDGNVSNDLPVPQRRELPFEKDKHTKDKGMGRSTPLSNRSGISSLFTPAKDTRSPLAHKMTESMLRHKPLSALRLDDFRVNPKFNDGHNYAYSEVVRGKDARACLPGCTDMHCCGKQFRALAISQRPIPPLSAAQRQEEQKLLEDYLGDYAYRLGSMSKEERMDLWIEAKTQELANKYGKHRHRYSRMRSPPGFWNADFPSTQELQADKAEAEKRERQAVQERYREAMRAEGRWVFRDE